VEAFPWTSVPSESAGRDAERSGTPVADAAREAADAAAASGRLAALERDAFVKGYGQGERSGLDAAARQGEASLRRLAETIEEMAALRADLIRRSEREVVNLAVSIAERVIRREISLDRNLVVAIAKVAIDQLGERASATIRLHPADHAAFLAASPGTPYPGPVEIAADRWGVEVKDVKRWIAWRDFVVPAGVELQRPTPDQLADGSMTELCRQLGVEDRRPGQCCRRDEREILEAQLANATSQKRRPSSIHG
jgi:hypothetical protein